LGDAEAIAEAVQRPTMKFVATKTADQLDLQALHRVRERLGSHRTGIINQIRAFLLERGVCRSAGTAFLTRRVAGHADHAPLSCRHAWCAPSRTWLATGAGVAAFGSFLGGL
jgi:transposase